MWKILILIYTVVGPEPVRWLSKFRRQYALCLTATLLSAHPAVAVESPESPAAIAATVENYLMGLNTGSEAVPRVTVGQIDPRLRLGQCGQSLEAYTPPGQRTVGSTMVGVRCNGPTVWTLYVQANVALLRPVLIARRPMPRGTALTASDVDLVEQDITRLTHGYLNEISQIDGMVLRRSISGGMALHPGLVQHPTSIRRGERITILGVTGGIEVRMDGVALADGAKGEIIPVRNLSSGREVEGVVVAPGLVQVRL